MRILVLVSTLTLSHASAYGAQVVLQWQYPLQAQYGALFILHVVQAGQGQPQASDRLLRALTPYQCTAWPGAVLPDLLCAELCLDPGTYTLTVLAEVQGQRSAASNAVRLDLTGRTSCVTTTPFQPPDEPRPKFPPIPIPPPPLPVPSPETVNLAGLVNFGCVSWKATPVLPPCVCGFPPQPCAQVEYYEPSYLVEIVKHPGQTLLPGVTEILRAAGVLGRISLWGAGGAMQSRSAGRVNKQFSEAHIFPFPQVLGGPCTSCAPSVRPLVLHYASELDAATWRTAVAAPNLLTLGPPIGVWQRLYPRGGTSIHSSEPVASGIATVRALDIAAQPVGIPPNVEVHAVLNPIPGMLAVTSCMQLSHPRQGPCISAGTFPWWDVGMVSPRGTYLWTIWIRRQCCVNPSQVSCGITLPGLGGQGQNFCILPSPPSP